MKLASPAAKSPAAFAFSILKRIVMGETSRHVHTKLLAVAPFSILKRIVMGETTAIEGWIADQTSFQYPQADRDG